MVALRALCAVPTQRVGRGRRSPPRSRPSRNKHNSGTRLAYDAGGNRRTASFYQSNALIQEAYNFDAENRLTDTNRAGLQTSLRTYDLAGRVKEYTSFSNPGVQNERRVMTYNANGTLTQQDSFNASNVQTTRLWYFADAAGNTTQYNFYVYNANGTEAYHNAYTYDYLKFDAYKESVVHGYSTYYQPGNSTYAYDANENLTSVVDSGNGNNNRTMIVNPQGLILQKTQSGLTDYYFYANANPIGSTSGSGVANFDFNYTPVSEQYPTMAPTSYAVGQGDTLKSIALAVYGDGALWYLIADANGLHTDSDMRVGQTLTIPNTITNLHNDVNTHKVYSPGAIIGDTTPTLPDPPPPPKKKHSFFAMLLVIIVAVIVTIFTAGAAAMAMAGTLGSASGIGAIMGAGMTTLAGGAIAAVGVAGSVLGSGAVLAAAAIGGAVGSIASQGVAMATGLQDKFSWKQVGLGAVGAAVTAGMGASGLNGVIGKAIDNPYVAAFAQGAVRSTLTQGISVATGLQKKFDWRSVAASAVAGGVGYGVGQALSGTSLPSGVLDFAKGFGAGVASAAVRGGSTRKQLGNIATDALASVIGNGIADDMASHQGSGVTGQFGGLLALDTEREAEAKRLNAAPGDATASGYPVFGSGAKFPDADSNAPGDGGAPGAPDRAGSERADLAEQRRHALLAYIASGQASARAGVSGEPGMETLSNMGADGTGVFAWLAAKRQELSAAAATTYNELKAADENPIEGYKGMGGGLRNKGLDLVTALMQGASIEAASIMLESGDEANARAALAGGQNFSLDGYKYALDTQAKRGGAVGADILVDAATLPLLPIRGGVVAEEIGARVVGREAAAVANTITREGIVGNLGEVVQPHLKVINELDVDALVGFRGSLARGFKGEHKGGVPFNVNDFDVDAFIVSDKLATEFGSKVRFRSGVEIEQIANVQKSIDSALRQNSAFGGLRQEPFTFRIFTQNDITRLQSRGDAQHFFIKPQ